MSPTDTLEELRKKGILPDSQVNQLVDYEQKKAFSLHWELRALLYVGILLLSAGLGFLIYDNIDQLGRGALVATMAVGCLASFAFAWRFRPDWTLAHAKSRSSFGDYALLLACLLFLTLEGYAQYAYTLFGTRYGLVTLLPALLFLPLAYRFDHRGVLGMALTSLIAWVGVTVRPLELYFKTNFFDQRTVFSAIILSLLLIGVALTLEQRRIKAHFTYTYLTIAGNLLMVALLGGLFNFENLRLLFVLGLAVACFLLDRYGRQRSKHDGGSFLFLLMSAVYGYIGLTYLFFHYLHPVRWGDGLYYWYFILTGIALVVYLMSQFPKAKPTHESV
jgi:hypothetical protein